MLIYKNSINLNLEIFKTIKFNLYMQTMTFSNYFMCANYMSTMNTQI